MKMPHRRSTITPIHALLLSAVIACSGSERDRARPPNVVVIMLDTLRPDHLGFLGYSHETAPYLAGLAARAAVFPRALSTSSWTAPSTASMHTGLYSSGHGVDEGFFAHQSRAKEVARAGSVELPLNRLASGRATLASLLAEHGYHTFGVAANVNIGPEIGFDRGFEQFERFEDRPLEPAAAWQRGESTSRVSASADELVDRVIEWRVAKREPYFLYLHLNDAHHPYHKRAPWFEQAAAPPPIAAYNSEVSYLDAQLARLEASLELGADDVIVVVSDHGEAFGEHGRYFHREGLYGELQRTLLMVSAPARGVEAGDRSAVASLIDVAPTVLDLAGVELDSTMDGRSLLPLLRGEWETVQLEEAWTGRALFGHRAQHFPRERHAWSVTRGRWKLIDEYGRLELYDVVSDPGELQDLAVSAPPQLEQLLAELHAFRQRWAKRPVEQGGVTLDERTLEQLRSLGYTGDDEDDAGSR